MRAHEFLTENAHEKAARDALITLLTTNHALGIKSLSMDQLIKSLENRNFFVDPDWVSDQVKDIPVVNPEASNFKTVVLQLSRAQASDSEPQPEPKIDSDQDQVERMAKRAMNARRG
jgi:hypothetical protein